LIWSLIEHIEQERYTKVWIHAVFLKRVHEW
jgi:hypothetical protein